MSLYGTRDAAANSQAEVRKTMLAAGFTVSRYNPSIFCPQQEGPEMFGAWRRFRARRRRRGCEE
eukprot:1265743-Lingulodinium_polyedra.AAC.1